MIYSPLSSLASGFGRMLVIWARPDSIFAHSSPGSRNRYRDFGFRGVSEIMRVSGSGLLRRKSVNTIIGFDSFF